MRKQTKLVAVLSAASLLSYRRFHDLLRATGWTEEDGRVGLLTIAMA